MVASKEDTEKTIFSIVRDVTAEIQAKEDLELSLEGGELGLWHVDLERRTVTLDSYCSELLELTNSNVFSYEDIVACIDDNEKEEVKEGLCELWTLPMSTVLMLNSEQLVPASSDGCV